MSKLNHLTVAETLAGLKAKKFTACEVTEAHLAAQETVRPLNLFITETADRARKDAKAADERRGKGAALPLDGVPIALKDNYCTKGVPTTAGSNILKNFTPPYESTVSGKLRAAGTVLLGKLNLDEFAMGSATITGFKGAAINPWTGADPARANRKLVAGGSSGALAATVAARCGLAATGSDTGGSIRQPASFCGTVGLKPTYGRASRWGLIAYGSSLDCPSVTARDVTDVALLFEHMAGFDAKDSTSIDAPVPSYAALLDAGVKGLKIGIPAEYRADPMPKDVDDAWQKGQAMLKAAGAEIVPVSLPLTKYALPTYYIIALAEASSNLARFDGVRYGHRAEKTEQLLDMYAKSRAEGFSKEVRRRIMLGTFVLSAGYYDAYYGRAQKVRARLAADFKTALTGCDLLLVPVAPSTAFGHGEKQDDPVAMYLEDIFTVPISLAGLPAISVPVAQYGGLPMNLQLVGRPLAEETVFRAARALEKEAGLKLQPPFMA